MYSDIGGWLGVNVKVTVAADIASDQSLGSFDTDFSSSVGNATELRRWWMPQVLKNC